ncbi:MAG: hypothetical protein D6748_03875 [Calditrichaeota bacterium]|nr:MAG: hypothetical protein D6748_03875 [Calditrichota bacterium]
MNLPLEQYYSKKRKNRSIRRTADSVRPQFMERRHLVGRRYEDYLRNNIIIQLSAEEHAWRMIILDPRYHPLLERRHHIRRQSDTFIATPLDIFLPDSSFTLLNHFLE